MPLPAGFWTLASRVGYWPDDFTGSSAVGTADGSYKRFAIWAFPSCFQAPAAGGQQGDDPGFDTGYFFMDDGAGGVHYGDNHQLGGWPPDTAKRRQHKLMVPDVARGDLMPVEGSTIPGPSGAAYYVTPWVYDAGAIYPYPDGAAGCWFLSPGAGTYEIWHYRPFAWWGDPATVVCRIMMDAGLDPTLFDQDSCDDAYDAYDAATADDPWSYYWLYGGSGYQVGTWRRIGEEVHETIARIMRTCRDYWGVDMRGRFAIWSKTRPNVLVGLDADDVLDIDWRWTADYTFTSWATSYGHVWRQYGDNGSRPGSALNDFGVAEERKLESHRGGKWVDDNSWGTTPFGRELWLPGNDDIVDYSGSPRQVKRSHIEAYYGDWGNAFLDVIEGWPMEDHDLRREITVRQNLLGLAYGPGWQVQDCEVTGDGASIATRCIGKTIDFRSMTVTSTLIEETAAS